MKWGAGKILLPATFKVLELKKIRTWYLWKLCLI